ncbi:hypothetical protein GCM10009760_08680 [Kitasatospora kazusensis]|uniref:Uncharacterized protein n=1 Tax=Kitasatospora kazusensis TaxID=407974 RepID=A0ABP5KIM5_9ACTN
MAVPSATGPPVVTHRQEALLSSPFAVTDRPDTGPSADDAPEVFAHGAEGDRSAGCALHMEEL